MNTGSYPHCCLCVSGQTASELRIQSLWQLHYDTVPSSQLCKPRFPAAVSMLRWVYVICLKFTLHRQSSFSSVKAPMDFRWLCVLAHLGIVLEWRKIGIPDHIKILHREKLKTQSWGVKRSVSTGESVNQLHSDYALLLCPCSPFIQVKKYLEWYSVLLLPAPDCISKNYGHFLGDVRPVLELVILIYLHN